MHVVPLGQDRTFETHDVFFEMAEPTVREMEAFRYIEDVVRREEIDIVERAQRGMSTPAFERGGIVHCPAGSGKIEHAARHFHGLVIEAYSRAVA